MCDKCRGECLHVTASKRKKNLIQEGSLNCKECGRVINITKGVPRFVENKNYAEGFGFQWTKHAKTQYDSYTSSNLSKKRFFDETQWSSSLKGETILEAGSGSGRFTEIAASTDAFVISLDYSNAVEANYAMNGMKENVLIIQADIYNMPFPKRYFDKIFCFGVLQHTPDVKKTFMLLPRFLKPDGSLVIDIYKKTFLATWLSAKYYVRTFTKNMESMKLYKFVQRYIDFMWPVAMLISKIPKIGSAINHRLLVAEYTRNGFSGDILKEMAYLDTFDMLSPKYDSPQTLKTVIEWFNEAGLDDIYVSYGYNGIVGRGRFPVSHEAASCG